VQSVDVIGARLAFRERAGGLTESADARMTFFPYFDGLRLR